MTKNKKVPFAILSCFTIAFAIQAILKLCKVFVFEKALNWEIFAIIDNSKALSIIYYSCLVLSAMYCLSFAMTGRWYSKKWYHYVIMIVSAFGITTIKFLTGSALTTESSVAMDILYDVLLYVVVPIIIQFTTEKENRIFDKLNWTSAIMVSMIQILLYFLYLGLNYWSGILNSIIPQAQYVVYSSSMILLQSEVYIGLGSLMMTMNMLVQKFIEKEENMFKPVNIATEQAKVKELKRVKEIKAKSGK